MATKRSNEHLSPNDQQAKRTRVTRSQLGATVEDERRGRSRRSTGSKNVEPENRDERLRSLRLGSMVFRKRRTTRQTKKEDTVPEEEQSEQRSPVRTTSESESTGENPTGDGDVEDENAEQEEKEDDDGEAEAEDASEEKEDEDANDEEKVEGPPDESNVQVVVHNQSPNALRRNRPQRKPMDEYFNGLSAQKRALRTVSTYLKEFEKEVEEPAEDLDIARLRTKAGFDSLVEKLDTKDTYQYVLDPSMRIDPATFDYTSRSLRLSGDPYSVYDSDFNPEDEALQQLFKTDADKVEAISIFERAKEKMERQLEMAIENERKVDRILRQNHQVASQLKRQLGKINELIEHEIYFPDEYIRLRVKQREYIRSQSEWFNRNQRSYMDRHDDTQLDDALLTYEPRISLTPRPPEIILTAPGAAPWSSEEEAKLMQGMKEFRGRQDKYILIKEHYGAAPGQVLWERTASQIREKAKAIKAEVVKAGNRLPRYWNDV